MTAYSNSTLISNDTNPPLDYNTIPDHNAKTYFDTLSAPNTTEGNLNDDINAFLKKTTLKLPKSEDKLIKDIEKFVEGNSKKADERMNENIDAFIRRCRSPSFSLSSASDEDDYIKNTGNTKCPYSHVWSRPHQPGRKLVSKHQPRPYKKSIRKPTSPPPPQKSYSRSPVKQKSLSLSPEPEKLPQSVPRKSFLGSNYKSRNRFDSRPLTASPIKRKRERSPLPPTPRYRPVPRNLRPRTNYRPSSRDADDKPRREKSVSDTREREDILLRDQEKKLEALSKLKPEEIIQLEKKIWTKSEPLPLYYTRKPDNFRICEATPKLKDICSKFEENLINKPKQIRTARPQYEAPFARKKTWSCCHKNKCHSSASSGSSSENGEEEEEEEESAVKILDMKHKHPSSLHKELWFNDPGQMNDGALCRCSARAARSGIRHGIYQGEESIKPCDPNTNNLDRLYHYRITLSPPTNFLTKMPTVIEHDDHEYIFEGFSMFTHEPLGVLPTCKVIRFNINYTILYIEEKTPENFVIKELDLFFQYLFYELLELVDFTLKPSKAEGETCPLFHFMPRFVRDLAENGKEILGMGTVMTHLINSYRPLVPESKRQKYNEMSSLEWQDVTQKYKGMIVTYPGAKPSSVRVDQLNRDDEADVFPEIVHFGIRPPQLSYAGNPEYQKAWRAYVKFRHLIANMPKPSFEDKRKLEKKEARLQEMRTQSKMKRGVTVTVSSQNFLTTGIMCDIVQHAMLLPVLVCHLRFHRSLQILERTIGYKFKNRYLLQLAMTHPSFRENFGTNPDHARNSLTNCGIRQPEYGDRRIHYMNTRKRGINTLINIMSRFGKKSETESNISHNERLEFLGDAVVEFITSIHLYHMFPDLEEGGLATYRAAIVQNQHLAVLAKVLNLQDYMLYAHGSDLCHELELRHAMANCFEALMGALFLDGGIKIPDTVFGNILFKSEPDLLDVWVDHPLHPLQEQEPDNDRHWIPSFPLLQRLVQFEESIGVTFNHIRLLARAFTDRSVGYTNLTLGSNQRMEFLGDTVLQLIASDYLYKYFPEHHEGHLSARMCNTANIRESDHTSPPNFENARFYLDLSGQAAFVENCKMSAQRAPSVLLDKLLRSSLVNNRTQSVVCDDLNIPAYALYSNPKAELKTKDRADLLESFLGALYIDKGLAYCKVFCNVCFFPRLQDFIMHQDWNDPKSKLQQCCLTLRTLDGGEPDIPIYKVIECKGPTNSRIYTVAVYFRGQRLAEASGHSIQQAEMNAANNALEQSQGLFPQLDHQKRVIAKSMMHNGRNPELLNVSKPDRLPNIVRAPLRSRDLKDRFKRNTNNVRVPRSSKQLGAKANIPSKPIKQEKHSSDLKKPRRSHDKENYPESRRSRSSSSRIKSPPKSIKSSIKQESKSVEKISPKKEKCKVENEIKDEKSSKESRTKKRSQEEKSKEEKKEKEKKEKKVKARPIKLISSKSKNLGSQSKNKVIEEGKGGKEKKIISAKAKRLLKKRLKTRKKLKRILRSTDKLKRQILLREKRMKRRAVEVELKRKIFDENVKKQTNDMVVERMRMILNKRSADPNLSSPEDSLKRDGEAASKPTLAVKPEPKEEKESVKSLVVRVPAQEDHEEVNTNPIKSENIVLPVAEKVSKLKDISNKVDVDLDLVKESNNVSNAVNSNSIIDKKHKRKYRKHHSRSRSGSVSSNSGKMLPTDSLPSSREKSASLESSARVKTERKSRSSSKKRRSQKSRDSSLEKSREKSKARDKNHRKMSVTPSSTSSSRHRSFSPEYRKDRRYKESKKSRSSHKKSSRSRKRTSKSVSVSPYREIANRKTSHRELIKSSSKSKSPKYPRHKSRRRSSLASSPSPPVKRNRRRSSSASSISSNRLYRSRKSPSPRRSRSPADRYSKKSVRSHVSRADRDEYLKYILNMSQSSCGLTSCREGCISCAPAPSGPPAYLPHPPHQVCLPRYPPPIPIRAPGPAKVFYPELRPFFPNHGARPSHPPRHPHPPRPPFIPMAVPVVPHGYNGPPNNFHPNEGLPAYPMGMESSYAGPPNYWQ